MPRTQHIVTRGATYYFRLRIPTALVKAGVYGAKKEIKFSLKTKDKDVAKRLAQIQLLKYYSEFDQKRQELRESDAHKTATRGLLAEKDARPLSSLSDLERQDFILRTFIRLEREAERNGRGFDATAGADRAGCISELGTDLAVLEGSSDHYAPIDWGSWLEDDLNAEGISVDADTGGLLLELRKRYQLAHTESAWRTVEAAMGNLLAERDSRFKGIHFDSTPLYAKDKTIGTLCTAYLEAKQKAGVSQASLDKYATHFRVLADCLGKDKALSTVSVEDACLLTDILGRITCNAAKRKNHCKSLTVVADLDANKDQPSPISPKTQRDYFNGISAIFGFAVEMEWLDSNPFRRKVVSSRLPSVPEYNKPMLTPNEMTLVFGSKEFRAERERQAKDGRPMQARFWIPWLCLFHGLRSNEASQLLVEDIEEEDGIAVLVISETDQENKRRKQLKTKSSRRRVPVHREVIEMGFLAFVEAQRAAGEVLLFPELTVNRRGSKADAVGKWFGRLRKRVLSDIPLERGAKGLHSLRHSFVRALRDAGVEDGIQFELGGWKRSKLSNSAAAYGSGYSVKRLKEAIDKVSYHGAKLSGQSNA